MTSRTIPGISPEFEGAVNLGEADSLSSDEAPRSDPETLRLGTERFSRYEPGDSVAVKYRLDRLVARDATGDLWLATNTRAAGPSSLRRGSIAATGLPVTLRLLAPRGGAEAYAFEEDVMRVAEASAKLAHPSLVRILDCGVSQLGDPFVVTERTDGERLSELLARERSMSPARAIQTILPVVEGLQTAHEHGLAHGDVRPGTILLGDGESVRPKILDFGLAAARGRRATEAKPYMAPEVLRGESEPDTRSDVFSLFMTLFEMMGGVVPPADELDESAVRRVSKDAAIVRVTADMFEGGDGELAKLLERGLARMPGKRFASMLDVGSALAVWLIGRGIEEDIEGVSLYARWLGQRASTPPPSSIEQAPETQRVPYFPDVATAVSEERTTDAGGSVVSIPAKAATPAETEKVTIPRRRWPGYVAFGASLATIAAGALVTRSMLAHAPAAVDNVVNAVDTSADDRRGDTSVAPVTPDEPRATSTSRPSDDAPAASSTPSKSSTSKRKGSTAPARRNEPRARASDPPRVQRPASIKVEPAMDSGGGDSIYSDGTTKSDPAIATSRDADTSLPPPPVPPPPPPPAPVDPDAL